MQIDTHMAGCPPRRPRRVLSGLAVVTAAVVALPIIAVVWIAFGVILGGRIGYVLFYDLAAV